MIEATASTVVLVFFRAIQQQNVIRGNYIAAAVTPFAIAAGEVATVLIVVSGGWQSIPWVGVGGAVGATAAMWIHRRFSRC